MFINLSTRVEKNKNKEQNKKNSRPEQLILQVLQYEALFIIIA